MKVVKYLFGLAVCTWKRPLPDGHGRPEIFMLALIGSLIAGLVWSQCNRCLLQQKCLGPEGTRVHY
jgi:hypothetical protein